MGLSRYAIVVATCRVVFYLLAFVCTIFSTSTADAGIVLKVEGGAAVFSGDPDSVNNDKVFPLLTGGKYSTGEDFQGTFYGQSVTSSLWIAENGNLNFNGDGSDFPRRLSNATVSSRIAPFWDDFHFLNGQANQIVNHSNPGSYLAITWKDAILSLDLPAGSVDQDTLNGLKRTTQVIWFEKDMPLNGFDFKKDDIAFGYSGFREGNIDATIGVKSSPEFKGIPGGTDGLISSSQSGLIPWNDNEFLLFRSDGSSYTVGREFITAVPEPSSLFLAISSIALAFAKWRRQIFGRFAKCSTK